MKRSSTTSKPRSVKKVAAPRSRERHQTKGSKLLTEHVKRHFDTLDGAARSLSSMTGDEFTRASIWHWARGVHVPSRQSADALHKWAGIPLDAWNY